MESYKIMSTVATLAQIFFLGIVNPIFRFEMSLGARFHLPVPSLDASSKKCFWLFLKESNLGQEAYKLITYPSPLLDLTSFISSFNIFNRKTRAP